MTKIITIIGARPQFIKAAVLSSKIVNKYEGLIDEILIHTGQHYDSAMSDIFFSELKIPKPKYQLNIGSHDHGKQTALMLVELESIMVAEKPDFVLVYGDTNSTLAGGLAAAKLNIPVIHVEAGVRSHNLDMPEEVNRIIVDEISSVLFAPNESSKNYLVRREGVNELSSNSLRRNKLIVNSGDIMYEGITTTFKNCSKEDISIIQNGEGDKRLILMTIHRPQNTDCPYRLTEIIESALELAIDYNIVFTVHPRTRKKLEEYGLLDKILACQNFYLIGPQSYFSMLKLQELSILILTDSGGLQKEAYIQRKPCLVIRDETEWMDLMKSNCFALAKAEKSSILRNFWDIISKDWNDLGNLFGEGNTSEIICETILNYERCAEYLD